MGKPSPSWKIKNVLVPLPGLKALLLPREELLKLKMAGWSQKPRCEGPRKENNKFNIVNLCSIIFLEGEFMEIA
jgi:hypothetical protein